LTREPFPRKPPLQIHKAAWWKKYRKPLEKMFEQESIVVRVQKIAVV
jgi:hypothetical protein